MCRRQIGGWGERGRGQIDAGGGAKDKGGTVVAFPDKSPEKRGEKKWICLVRRNGRNLSALFCFLRKLILALPNILVFFPFRTHVPPSSLRPRLSGVHVSLFVGIGRGEKKTETATMARSPPPQTSGNLRPFAEKNILSSLGFQKKPRIFCQRKSCLLWFTLYSVRNIVGTLKKPSPSSSPFPPIHNE